jgi:hypothetical protein
VTALVSHITSPSSIIMTVSLLDNGTCHLQMDRLSVAVADAKVIWRGERVNSSLCGETEPGLITAVTQDHRRSIGRRMCGVLCSVNCRINQRDWRLLAYTLACVRASTFGRALIVMVVQRVRGPLADHQVTEEGLLVYIGRPVASRVSAIWTSRGSDGIDGTWLLECHRDSIEEAGIGGLSRALTIQSTPRR